MISQSQCGSSLTYSAGSNKFTTGILPREPVEAPIYGEMPFPKLEELLIDNSEEASDLLSKIPTLDDFEFDDEEKERLEKFIEDESKEEFKVSPGEAAAKVIMKKILSDSSNFDDYFYVKNSLFQRDLRKTNLYPWLSNGCLSPRRLFSELSKLESR